MDQQEINDILAHIQKHGTSLKDNHTLIDIYEGNLKPYVVESLRGQLSPQSFAQTEGRISPINVLQRIVDKQSKIYQQNPTRRVEDENKTDQELLEWYEECYRVDTTMNNANEFFNMSKSTLLEPYVHERKPRLRVVPNDRYLPYSKDEVDPTNPTHMIISHGSEVVTVEDEAVTKHLYRVYTAEQFVVIDSDGNVRTDIMERMGNPEGENPFGFIPFIYINRSKNFIVPKLDTDMIDMTVLIPVTLSDLNYAVKFLCFSQVYTIDATIDGMVKSPNSVWQLKTDKDAPEQPKIGTIKPEVDSDKVLSLIQAELSLWLNSKGIKPGTVGKLTAENFASGISKMIDEMDTSEDRTKQVSFFLVGEDELWTKTGVMNNYWVETQQIDQTSKFSEQFKVATEFSEQLPLVARGEVVEDLKSEVDAGFTTKRRAIEKLNPKMSSKEIDALMQEIEEENTIKVPVVNPFSGEENEESEETEEDEDEQDA